MYNNWYTHYSRKSVFVQKKNYQRSHNVCFQNRQGAFHWTSLYPGELPRIPVKNFNTHTQKKFEGKKKDIYTDSRGSNIFLKVTLWSSKIWTVIFFFVASCLSVNDGPDEAQCVLVGGQEVVVTEGNTRTVAPTSPSACAGGTGQRNQGFWNQTYSGVANNEYG